MDRLPGALALFLSVALAAAALWQVVAWLWVPLGLWLLRGWLAPAGSPSPLLVLRVFGRDAEVETLFDRVVERWRLSGNTLLIAGTDLASRTLDPDDLFAFLNGRLADRFIARAEDIPRRLAEPDLEPDPDGRCRVNEFHCYDTTRQPALRALAELAGAAADRFVWLDAGRLGCARTRQVPQALFAAPRTHLQSA